MPQPRCRASDFFLVVLAWTALSPTAPAQRRVRGPPRHGGGAGGARRPHRRRDLRARRQRGRRRGRDRLRAGGDLSARRQYRRRRLHGDPPRQRRNAHVAIDYRETAPKAATRDMFLDEKGNADPRKSRDQRACDRRARHGRGACARASPIRLRQVDARRTDRAGDQARARGIPDRGRPRRFAAARHDPALALAGVGEDLLHATAERSRPATGSCSATSPTRWRRSRKQGRAPSTRAPIAQKIAAAVQAAGGIMTVERPEGVPAAIVRRPVRGNYRGHEIVSMPPSSSGGVRADPDAQHPGGLQARRASTRRARCI